MPVAAAVEEPRPPPASQPDPIHIQRASLGDLGALCELEQIAFSGDRISPRSWRRLLGSMSATVTVARRSGQAANVSAVIGATVVLQRGRSSVARLYSIAVAPAARGHGIAGQLLDDATERMREEGAALLRLETRADNHVAQALFQRHGFTPLDRKPVYYEDGADALRFQKSLWNQGGTAGLHPLRQATANRRSHPLKGDLNWLPIT